MATQSFSPDCCGPTAVSKLLGRPYESVCSEIEALGLNHRLLDWDSIPDLLSNKYRITGTFSSEIPWKLENFKLKHPGDWILFMIDKVSSRQGPLYGSLKNGELLDNEYYYFNGIGNRCKVRAGFKLEEKSLTNASFNPKIGACLTNSESSQTAKCPIGNVLIVVRP